MSTIKLVNGSCANENVDAVVNAANRGLREGGGICGAIFSKAGSAKLTAACQKYKTPLADGEAVITPAFDIKNARFIIHAVGPDFGFTPDAFDKLYAAYYNSLVVLKEYSLHSISFPLISAGIFGGRLENPAFVSAQHCLKAYNDFINANADWDIDVTLCAFSQNEYQQALKCFE